MKVTVETNSKSEFEYGIPLSSLRYASPLNLSLPGYT